MPDPAGHASLAAGRWQTFTLAEQLANIGSEVSRALRAHAAGNPDRTWNALTRALELFDMTAADDRWRGRRKEILRAREVVCDYLVGDNQYRSTADSLDRYFLAFATLAHQPRQQSHRGARSRRDPKACPGNLSLAPDPPPSSCRPRHARAHGKEELLGT